MAFLLARNRVVVEENDEQLKKIISNQLISNFFLQICKDFNIMTPKKPREVYKEMIAEKQDNVSSAQLNLADAFVNGLVNLGTSKDSLFSNAQDPFITKVKTKGILTAVGTLGLIHMWNFEEFSSVISDYFDLKDGFAKAGACIALGLTTTGIQDENDPALALLEDSI